MDGVVRTKKCKANGTGIDIGPKEAHYQDERDFKSIILPANKRRKINDVNKYTRTQTYGNIWIRNVPFSRRPDTGTSGSNKTNNDQVQVGQTSCSPSFTVICSFNERKFREGSAHNIVSPDCVTSPSNRQISNSYSSSTMSYFSDDNDKKYSRQENISRNRAKFQRSYILHKEWHDRQHKSEDSNCDESTCEDSADQSILACNESRRDNKSTFDDSSCVDMTWNEMPCNSSTIEQEKISCYFAKCQRADTHRG